MPDDRTKNSHRNIIDLALARLARSGKGGSDSPPSAKQGKVLRLILEQSGRNIRGRVKYGDAPLYPWSQGPAEIMRFAHLHYGFVPSCDYLADFSSLSCPRSIHYVDQQGKEYPLEFRSDQPLFARAIFSLNRDSVSIAREFEDGFQPPATALLEGELLIDPAAGIIRPIKDIMAWQMVDSIRNELKSFAEEFGEKVRGSATRFSVSASFFNIVSIGLQADRMKEVAAYSRFLAKGSDFDPLAQSPVAYHLEILDELGDHHISLAPMGEAEGVCFPFSHGVFWLLSPGERSQMGQPLRAKKRVSAMIEACFASLDAVTATARNAAVRAALDMTDYPKRPVRTEANRIVKRFIQESASGRIILRTTPDGWSFALDSLASQTRLMAILYRFFGLDAFVDGYYPGELEVTGDRLLPRLGELVEILRASGFDLRLNGTALSSGAWHFQLDTRRDGIDWFELSPEIRCNGELLAEEEIRAILEQGIFRQGDACYLVSDEQRRIMELLFGQGGGKGKKKKKGSIVRIPRLQILDWLELRAHGVTLRLPPEEEQLLASLTRLDKIEETPLPDRLRTTLRHYQRDGYDWLAFLYRHRFGACLADDMGLGKTIQTIAFLAGISEGRIPSACREQLPHLIVVPPSLLFNWESEINRFYPELRVVTYAGLKRKAEFQGADIVLTSYGILQRDIAVLAPLNFHVAVFDEAQQVKNIHSATTGAARRISARFKLALTGTPMENHLGEYYAIMDLCVPGLLGNYEEFRRRIDIRGFGGIDTLVRRTRPFILRRTKQMISDELPPRVEADLYLEMTAKQRALYQKTVEDVKIAVNEAFRLQAPGQARLIALTAILRLRQICLSPALLTAAGKGESPKLECLIEQLEELRDEGHSVLVFSQFTSYLDIVEAGFKQHKLPYLRLDGSTPVVQRKGLVNSFQKSDEPLVFLISLKAGGKGLNLTRATYVYHLDPWWNPAVENQASDRAHRIGQTAKVTVTRLLMRHTVEEKMMALKERKLKLYKALLEDGSGSGASLSKEDFDFLLAP